MHTNTKGGIVMSVYGLFEKGVLPIVSNKKFLEENYRVINRLQKRSIQIESSNSRAFQLDFEMYEAVNMPHMEYNLIITNPRTGVVIEVMTRTNLYKFMFDAGVQITKLINKEAAELAKDFLFSHIKT
jgi:hypothetical protein